MVPSRSPGVLWALFGERVLVFEPTYGYTHRLNATGSALWVEVDGERDAAGIAERLAESYGVASSELIADVESTLIEWNTLGLCTPSRADGQGPPHRSSERVRNPVAVAPTGEAPLPDGISWTYELGPYRGFDVEFTIVCDDEDLGAYLQTMLVSLRSSEHHPPATSAAQYAVLRRRSDERTYDVYLDTVHLQALPSMATAVEYLLWHLNRTVVEKAECVVVHAAGVALGGRGIVIPGKPDAGKSTLAVGLVRAGFDYLSDEAVGIEPNENRLLPFPKPIGIDRGSQDVLAAYRPEPGSFAEGMQTERWYVPPERIRQGSIADLVRLDCIVTTQYEEGARTVAQPLAAIDALAFLLSQTFDTQQVEANFDALVSLVRETPAFRLTVGDLQAAVSEVERVVRR